MLREFLQRCWQGVETDGEAGIATGVAGRTVTARLPDAEYWREQINCQNACPVHTDARGYVRAIAAGDDELAYLIARGPNPLASICGRVCGAPCEVACRRGQLDQPIAIRALKRFVCSHHGPEARGDASDGLIEFLKDVARRSARAGEGVDELLPLLQSLAHGDVIAAPGRSVGIIGSGPAGLAAAHDLAILGLDVTVYEVEPVLGGMLATGVPEYRLPRDLIRAEVRVIEALGVRAVTGCEVGRDITLSELRRQHEAVIIAVGAKRSRPLPIPGADAPGVLGGVEFLRDVAIGNPPTLGRRVVVIGGGNVAYDVGRTVVRQISMDAARTALREASVSQVYLCSLESLAELPADDLEITEGDEEGILRRHSLGPTEIVTDAEGRATAVAFRKCLRVFDEQRRFAPLFDDSVREVIECDNVLVAIGQQVDLRFVEAERDGLELTDRGFIACDQETGVTSAPDVYVAGDLATGPGLMIHAIASGKQVARQVYQSLTGRALSYQDLQLHLVIPDYAREVGYELQSRVAIPTRPVQERLRSQAAPVDANLDEAAARCEAGRCFDCGVNTIFDGEKCILCGGCVDVCPELCLRIVSADRLSGEGGVAEVLGAHLGALPPAGASTILKDETVCIRCGLCATRCPVGAITMERFLFKEAPQCANP
jgi:NADPH-dependent glutamate synthase beta subunit-like oxidoreductase/ferredoxin